MICHFSCSLKLAREQNKNERKKLETFTMNKLYYKTMGWYNRLLFIVLSELFACCQFKCIQCYIHLSASHKYKLLMIFITIRCSWLVIPSYTYSPSSPHLTKCKQQLLLKFDDYQLLIFNLFNVKASKVTSTYAIATCNLQRYEQQFVNSLYNLPTVAW